MTIEFSLRRRAAQARYMAVLWLSLAVAVLVVGYISLPTVAGKTLESIARLEGGMTIDAVVNDSSAKGKFPLAGYHFFALVIMTLCLVAVSFAGYLLGRTAFIEIELAARFNGLADALCIAGDNFGQLEKAAALLVPRPKYFPEASEKDLKTFLEVVKSLRG